MRRDVGPADLLSPAVDRVLPNEAPPMIPRAKALAVSSPGIAALTAGLLWWVLDPKGDARRWLLDRLRL